MNPSIDAGIKAILNIRLSTKVVILNDEILIGTQYRRK